MPFAAIPSLQAGTEDGNHFSGVAVRPTDGAALLAGWTHDKWVDIENTNFFSDFGGVLLEAGGSSTSPATTPAPAIAPQPVATTPGPVAPDSPSTPQPAPASSCGETESFRITSEVFPSVDGCYQATSSSFSTGSAVETWTVSGEITLDEVVVSGNTDTSFFLRLEIPAYCRSIEIASTVHPTDATWECKGITLGLALFLVFSRPMRQGPGGMSLRLSGSARFVRDRVGCSLPRDFPPDVRQSPRAYPGEETACPAPCTLYVVSRSVVSR